ncbi:hypothetical protein HF394_17505 [Planococcus glaciei]|uniref:Uncharacterized protein n=1 Tax=Planococcus glaciei TaxID=459472 RepID=A0A7H8QFJ3_9BACL|nr:hypothetical protein [Planococcus glaciei]QKX52225.1 hypothetical protein HF394_17505 [Planococcus glaciei]
MGKRIFFVMLAVCFLLFSLFSIYSFSMSHEPAPNKRQVEKSAAAFDLQKFGPVEGTFLHTPKNYGFYNKQRLYIVEQSFGDNEEFSNRYAVIESGVALTAALCQKGKSVERFGIQIKAQDACLSGRESN